MKVVRPVVLADTGPAPYLVSSSVAEPSGDDPAVWAVGTTYALGDQAYRAGTHRIYESLQAGNLGNTPESSPTWWTELQGTNKWAMFDQSLNSATSGATPLLVTFDPGITDALVLLGLVGNTATVTMTDGAGGPTVYSRTVPLQVAKVADWYAYYFEPFRQIPVIALTDLPPYLNARVTLQIDADATAACGACIPGRTFNIGGTKYGVQAGIRDYSRKTVNEDTGAVTLERRRFAKTLRATVRLDSALFSEVHAQLEDLRATPVVWVGDDTADIDPLTVFGFYRDFQLVVDYPTAGLYFLEIEGLA